MSKKSAVALPSWIDITETSRMTGVPESTIRKWCASGAIPPETGRRFGYVWRFRRSVIETEGFGGVDREKIRSFRRKYSPMNS